MYPRHEVTRPRPAAGPAEQPAAVSAAEAGLALHLYISVDNSQFRYNENQTQKVLRYQS